MNLIKIVNIKWIILSSLILILAACTPSATPDLSLAGTYAAQTLEAMPSETPTDAPETQVTPTPTLDITPLPEVGPVGPSDFPEDVNPLTGLAVEDTELLERRPVFVKVANYPASGRPHAGLSFADMVFEYYIGFGGNRFIALYYGQNAEQIGPMRSGRLVDPKLTTLYEGVLGFHGAYVTILESINSTLGARALNGTTGICPAICDDGRGIVTSVFGDSAALTDLAENRGVENRKFILEGMAFDPAAPEGGQDGQQATVLFSSVNRGEWRYDPQSGYYLRWIEDADSQDNEMIPLVDRLTDQQLAFSNVIVLFTEHTEFSPTLHDMALWNVTGQRALVFRDGNVYDGTWTTPSTNQPIQFLDAEGEILPLKPGNTWVVIFGQSSGVVEDEGTWTFNFRIP
jgi:hypothetical protein